MELYKTYIVLVAILASACTTNAQETCFSNSTPFFTKAISLKLSELNFDHTLQGNGKLCFNKNKINEFNSIKAQVTQYFHSVAAVLKTQIRKEKVFSWLSESKTPFYTHENDRGAFVVIHSLTEELANDNAIKLNELLYE